MEHVLIILNHLKCRQLLVILAIKNCKELHKVLKIVKNSFTFFKHIKRCEKTNLFKM